MNAMSEFSIGDTPDNSAQQPPDEVTTPVFKPMLRGDNFEGQTEPFASKPDMPPAIVPPAGRTGEVSHIGDIAMRDESSPADNPHGSKDTFRFFASPDNSASPAPATPAVSETEPALAPDTQTGPSDQEPPVDPPDTGRDFNEEYWDDGSVILDVTRFEGRHPPDYAESLAATKICADAAAAVKSDLEGYEDHEVRQNDAFSNLVTNSSTPLARTDFEVITVAEDEGRYTYTSIIATTTDKVARNFQRHVYYEHDYRLVRHSYAPISFDEKETVAMPRGDEADIAEEAELGINSFPVTAEEANHLANVLRRSMPTPGKATKLLRSVVLEAEAYDDEKVTPEEARASAENYQRRTTAVIDKGLPLERRVEGLDDQLNTVIVKTIITPPSTPDLPVTAEIIIDAYEQKRDKEEDMKAFAKGDLQKIQEYMRFDVVNGELWATERAYTVDSNGNKEAAREENRGRVSFYDSGLLARILRFPAY
jgi:hypothetical protein